LNIRIEDIIKQSQRGDEKAQRELYDRFRTRWFMISMRYGKNKMQAEDIFQEGLIRIYNDLHQYKPQKGAFASWSSRVLVNAALRYLQKSNWVNTLSDLDQAIHYHEESDMVLDQIATKELTHMIQQLPIGYRLVFNMYALEGYTHKEIAENLGISEGTSKSQLYKARKQLQYKLESQLKITRT